MVVTSTDLSCKCPHTPHELLKDVSQFKILRSCGAESCPNAKIFLLWRMMLLYRCRRHQVTGHPVRPLGLAGPPSPDVGPGGTGEGFGSYRTELSSFVTWKRIEEKRCLFLWEGHDSCLRTHKMRLWEEHWSTSYPMGKEIAHVCSRSAVVWMLGKAS